jgi:cyanophycinase
MPSDSSRSRAGTLIAIGGAEDKLGNRTILSRFVQLAGGSSARVAVISTASSLRHEITELYRSLFLELGAAEVHPMHPSTRAEAEAPEMVAAVRGATGVFLTGGNQLRLSMVVQATSLGRALVEAHQRGAVIGGTSAGASALSTHMVAFGRPGETPRQRMGQLSVGLGLLPGVIVDQHFGQRNRIGRLLTLVAQSPGQLGLGLDEDTAAVIAPDGVLEVLGKGAVTIVDGTDVVSDAFEVHRSRPILVSGAVVHSLPPGYRFDLAKRALLPRLQSLPAVEATPPDRVRVRRRPASPGRATAARRLAQAVDAEGAADRIPRRPGRGKDGRAGEEASQ